MERAKAILLRSGARTSEVPDISLDAVKLTRNWKQRPKSEIETELLRIVQTDSWILEGGRVCSPMRSNV